nr:TRAP transporter small permease subunit [Marinihelvus fidelis]
MTGTVERAVAVLGRAAAWLTLAMVVVTFGIVVLRYGLDRGWIWLQESVTWMHATVFMVAAAWTLQDDGHVRVDIFYRQASPRRQAWVDLLGTLILLAPFCIFVLLVGWDYVAASWRMREASGEAGGLAAVYLLKTLVLVMPLLLLAQALAALPRQLAHIRGTQAAA